MIPAISIIVPVYNVEKYLSMCIDSILAQSFTEFELLLIDDGSPDKSGEICDEYAMSDTRVRVIHQKNSGVTVARAVGVLNSSDTEFITFVDADDSLPITALSELYAAANSNYDIIVGNYDRNYRKYSESIISADIYSKMLLSGKVHFGPTARLYRRSLFNSSEIFNISRDIVVGEDLLMNLNLSLRNKKNVKIIPNTVYNYFVNPSSVMNTFTYTTEYIEKLYELEKNAVLTNEKHDYIIYCIEGVLCYKNTIIEHYFHNNKWGKTQFHTKLLKDIEEYGYKLPMYLKFSLSFSNPIFSFIHISLRRINCLLKNI